jgi:hypothetical protein
VELIVNNLGRVKQARLDIRPLTVFIGANHTNKTWTAYSLYGIACNLARIEFSTIRSRGFVASDALQGVVAEAADLLGRKLVEKPAQATTARITREELIRGVSPTELTLSRNTQGLSAVLGVPELTIPGASADLRVTAGEFERSVFSAMEVIYTPSDFEVEWKFITQDGSSQPHPYRLSLRGGRGGNGASMNVAMALKEHLVQAIGLLVYTLFDDVAVLPTERKALLSLDAFDLFYPSVLEARESAVPSPINDFLYMISSARRLRNSPGWRPEFPLRLADVLEKQIIQGKINFEDEEPSQENRAGTQSPRRRAARGAAQGDLSYATSDGVELPMHASASIVRSLAGLDIYLKEFCNHGGLLVIDEPDMNAHPEAQLKIIEFLAAIVQNGVRVVLTTHSPYILDHLSNLMQASRLGEGAQRTIASQFKLRMSESFLSPDQVSVYLFKESGEVEDILDREQGIIDLASFSRPTEYMANLVNAIWKASDDEVPQTVEQGNAI